MSAPSTADSISTTSSFVSSGVDSASPVSSHPASATLSFLEYYGIYPDSPLVDGRKSLLPRKKTMRRKTPLSKASSTQRESYSTFAITLSAASPTEIRSDATAKRFSSVPPPGLKPVGEINSEASSGHLIPPPGLSHSLNNELDPSTSKSIDKNQQPEVDSLLHWSDSSPRSRPLPTAVPPPYTKVSLTDASRTSDVDSPSTTIRILPTRTSTPIRRLPTIPMEPPPQPATTPRPVEQGNMPRSGMRHTVHPPPNLAILSAHTPPAKTSCNSPFSTVSPLAIGSLSPPPPAPIGARPRMRARSSSNYRAETALGAMY